MDMLLLKSCNTEKFKRILCLNFGRNPADFQEIGDIKVDLQAHFLSILTPDVHFNSKVDNREVGWWC